MRVIFLLLAFIFVLNVAKGSNSEIATFQHEDINRMADTNWLAALDSGNVYRKNALKSNNSELVVQITLDMAKIQLGMGRIDSTMMLVFEAQNLTLELPKPKMLYYSGRCNQLLGDVFYSRFIEEEAVMFFLQSLHQFAACRNFSGMAEVLYSLSSCFTSLNRLHYAEMSLEALNKLFRYTGLKYSEALYFETKADLLSNGQQLLEAKTDYLKALQLHKKLAASDKLSDIYLNIAICEYDLGNLDEALRWVDSATVFNTQNKYLKNIYEATYFKAEFIGQKNPTLGIEIASSALNQLEALNLNIHMGIYLKLITHLQKESKLFEAALKSNEQFNRVLNNIYGSNVERKIAGLQLEVETGKLNHRIGLLQKEQELATVNARSQRNMLFYFFLAIIVLFTMALNNMRRLQYRLYLLKEFALDFSWFQYVLAFIASLIYFAVLLVFINPFNLTQNINIHPWIHYGAIAFLASALSTAVIFLLPASWTAKPGFNSRFAVSALLFVVAINATVLLYAALVGIIGNSLYDHMNVFLVLTGITVIPVFYFIIYLEKVLLRKHIQMAGLLSNRIQSFKPKETEDFATIYSDRSRDMLEVPVANLILIEANGNYCKLYYLENKVLKSSLILISMTKVVEQLAKFSHFSRCHKSYIVNLKKVKKVMGNSHGYKLEIPFFEEPIPVSRSFAADFINDFDKVFKEGENRT